MRRTLFSAAVLVAFLLASTVMVVQEASAGWPKVKGHRCWGSPEGGTLKLYIKKMTPKSSSAKRYLVLGRSVSQDGNTIEALNGNAEIKDGTVHMTMTTTGEHEDQVFGYMGYAVFDKKTLDGSVKIMGVVHEKSGVPGNASTDYQGPIILTPKPCP